MVSLSLAVQLLLVPALSGVARADTLADYALAKVLSDAAGVFGEYDNSHGHNAQWMKSVADDTPIVHLNIPGIHDAATWNFSQATKDATPWDAATTSRDSRSYRCQSASIVDALNGGIRFFDLRYAMDPTDSFLVFWHQDALMSESSTVDSVMYGYYQWLEDHPTEVLFLSFQYQGSTKSAVDTPSNSAKVQRQLFGLLTSPLAKKYISQRHDELGSLGHVRGKIVLMRRFDLDQLDPSYDAALPGLHLSPAVWTDDSPDIALTYNAAKNLTAYIEDYYEPDDIPTSANASVNIAAKVAAVEAHFAKAVDPAFAPDSLFITFLSGEHVDSTPPVWPQIMALGNGSDYTPQGGVNNQLLPYLQAQKGKRVGIVVLDFWDQPSGLVDAILDL